MKKFTVWIVCLLLTAACQPSPTPPATPLPTPPASSLPPEERVVIPAPQSDAPTVEAPQLRLKISVFDKDTKAPVNADAIRIDDETRYNVQWMERAGLDGTVTHTIAITATGYQYIEFVINPRIKRHKFSELRIPLERLEPEARLRERPLGGSGLCVVVGCCTLNKCLGHIQKPIISNGDHT